MFADMSICPPGGRKFADDAPELWKVHRLPHTGKKERNFKVVSNDEASTKLHSTQFCIRIWAPPTSSMFQRQGCLHPHKTWCRAALCPTFAGNFIRKTYQNLPYPQPTDCNPSLALHNRSTSQTFYSTSETTQDHI